MKYKVFFFFSALILFTVPTFGSNFNNSNTSNDNSKIAQLEYSNLDGMTFPLEELSKNKVKFYIAGGMALDHFGLTSDRYAFPNLNTSIDVLDPEISGGFIVNPAGMSKDIALILGLDYQRVSHKNSNTDYEFRSCKYYTYNFNFNKFSIPIKLSVDILTIRSLTLSLQGGYKYILLKGNDEYNSKLGIDQYWITGFFNSYVYSGNGTPSYSYTNLHIDGDKLHACTLGIKIKSPDKKMAFELQTEQVLNKANAKTSPNKSSLTYKGADIKAAIYYIF
ncbi:MAG: hypothetical protein Q8859_07105 [Bacteroidota bacterium]|nr:hypothetical protein [Bacteroidota bacterium]